MSKYLLPVEREMSCQAGGVPGLDVNGLPTSCAPEIAASQAPRKKGSRAILREKAQAEEKAARAAEAAVLRARIQHGFKPPKGKRFSVDVEGQMLIGPAGGIGVTPLMAHTLAILSAPGCHAPEALLIAGWRDLEHLQEGFQAFEPKFSVLGLRCSQGPTGWRINATPARSKSSGST